MRKTFTLEIEFRGDMRGQEKRNVTEALQLFAQEQAIQTFGYEESNIGRYVFMAHPDYIDEQQDSYEVLVFRETLEPWLVNHLDIENYKVNDIVEQGNIFPRIRSTVIDHRPVRFESISQ